MLKRPGAGIVLALLLQPAAAERISQAEFKALTVSNNNVAIVDTRSEAEFARGHVPRALSLTEADLTSKSPRAVKTLAQLRAVNGPVVVYCACPAEITSLRMAESLREQGVRDARALTGGWVEWFNAGNPIEPTGK